MNTGVSRSRRPGREPLTAAAAGLRCCLTWCTSIRSTFQWGIDHLQIQTPTSPQYSWRTSPSHDKRLDFDPRADARAGRLCKPINTRGEPSPPPPLQRKSPPAAVERERSAHGGRRAAARGRRLQIAFR
ncbi:hypothetical protein EVAR_78531_1 [Eumeta japonica]|uniref:Uncharacterized protein n=1 Tax=Eumeta variegata TaxID=151549 RepID=A0A4C1W6Y8_EUMVA|nr:hypothetical protein EVAR_78531_1 [Eumeta japonica]